MNHSWNLRDDPANYDDEGRYIGDGQQYPDESDEQPMVIIVNGLDELERIAGE